MITGLVRHQDDNWREKGDFFGMSEGLLTFTSLPEAPLKDLRLSSLLTLSPHEVSLPDNLSWATDVWTAETLHDWRTLWPHRSVTTGRPTFDDGSTGARRE